jgi:predicted RNA binding protein YcfA (HicA-like mRNA interferase family)
MPKAPRLTAAEAEELLLEAGFSWLRSKGSHRIYAKGGRRIVVPFHSSAMLHPKIVKQVVQAIEEAPDEPQ